MPVSLNASSAENPEGAVATGDEGAVRRGIYICIYYNASTAATTCLFISLTKSRSLKSRCNWQYKWCWLCSKMLHRHDTAHSGLTRRNQPCKQGWNFIIVPKEKHAVYQEEDGGG